MNLLADESVDGPIVDHLRLYSHYTQVGAHSPTKTIGCVWGHQACYERTVQAHRCLSGLDVPKDVIVKTRAEFDFFREVRASLAHRISKQGKVLYEAANQPVAGLAGGSG